MRAFSRYLLATVFGLGLAAFPPVMPSAFADPHSDFSETDLNADGRIDRSEYHRRMTDRFYFLDADYSGSLSFSEIEFVGPGAFERADKDGDGRLAIDEYTNARYLDFEIADRNRDGVLTIEEVEAWSLQ